MESPTPNNVLRFIVTRAVIDIATGAIFEREGYLHIGSVAECKGASPQQQDLATQQQNFATTLSNNYQAQFGKQSAITSSLQSALQPIINAGSGQYGFSNAEDAAMRTQASAGTTAAFKSAKQSLGETQAAQGGGDTFLPSGVKTQQDAELATSAAQQESQQQLGITTAGYEAGRQQFDDAVNADNNLASVVNPDGAASVANSASNEAFSDATTDENENAAASPWNTVGGILGGAITAGVSGFTGGLGTSVGKGLLGSGK